MSSSKTTRIFSVLFYFLFLLLLSGCKYKKEDVYKTIVYPNNPWKYQVINPTKKLDQNSWLQGYGTIGEGMDTLLKNSTDTLFCETNFNAWKYRHIDTIQIRTSFESDYSVYLNNSLLFSKQIKDDELNKLILQYDRIDSVRNNYINSISTNLFISKFNFGNYLKRRNNILKVKFYNQKESGKDIKPYISLRQKTWIKITKDEIKPTQNSNTSNLPLVIINTFGKFISDSSYLIVDMGIINNEGRLNTLNDTCNEYNGCIKIKARGYTSKIFPKKSYNITTLQSDKVTDLNTSLLGMPTENEWILYGSYIDKSLIRNTLIYDLSNQIGLYAPRTRYCELYINNEYQGIYILIEKIKPDKNRIAIKKIKPSDTLPENITGGYIIKIDRNSDFLSEYSSVFNYYQATRYEFYYPELTKLATAQYIYVKNFIHDFESSLWNDDIKSDTTYLRYINIDSFIDYFLLQELSKNIDALKLSTFMYKDRNNKLSMGPIWDFDMAFGLVNFCRCYHYEESILLRHDYVPFWWYKLMENDYFREKLKRRWQELRHRQFKLNNIYKTIDNQVGSIESSVDKNYEKWSVLAPYIWPNYFNESTYNEYIDYLKFWIKYRVLWLDEYYNKQ